MWGREAVARLGVGTAAVVALVACSLVGLADRVEAADPLPPAPPPATFADGRVNLGAVAKAVVTGDVDGDDILDIVAAKQGTDTVAVALGNGDGTFGAAVEYSTGEEPDSVALGDFNGDDHLDIATANFSSSTLLASLGTVSIFLGNGDGTFAAAAAVSIPGSPYWVSTGDVNEDGNLDLSVATEWGTTGTAILLGNGDGTFATPFMARAGEKTEAAVLTDVDGDNHLDLVTVEAYASDGTVKVLLGDGAGAFSLDASLSTGTDNPMMVAAADLDGDGDVDLVAPTTFAGSVSVFLANGDGSFAPRVRYGNTADPESVAIGDVNRDTIPDIVLARDTGYSMVMFGNGDGTFTYFTQLGQQQQRGIAVVTGNFNGDSWLDAALVAHSSATVSPWVSVYVNTSMLALGAPVATAGSNGVTVTWTPPADVSTVTHYEVIVEGSGGMAPPPVVIYSPTNTSAVVTNLINGDTYRFRVAAHNAVGAGPLSAFSNSVVSATGLLAPTIGTATDDGMGGVRVSWTAPTADGGSPVTGYVVTPYIGYFAVNASVFNSTATTQSITNLDAGQTYRFRVRAINAASTSAYSKVTNAATAPPHMAPQAPTGATAVAGNAQATVSWTAPSHNGGSPITGYAVTAYIGYAPVQTRTFNSNAMTQVFAGLTNGTTYRFRIQARNGVGTGAFSKVSNPITPTA